MQYASFFRRLVAIIIDGFIISVPLSILLTALGLEPLTFSGVINPFSSLVPMLVYWAYFALQESSSYQATLGKRVMGLKVTDMQGNRINLMVATGRQFGRILSSIILFIGYLMAAFTSKKQTLHDMIAGTLVLQK